MIEISIDESAKAIEVAACDGPVRFHRILNPILMEDDEPNSEDPVDVVGHEGNNKGTGGIWVPMWL